MVQRLLTLTIALCALMGAQPRVDPRFTYHRIICVVPFTGSGTSADPKRPLYSPTPSAVAGQGSPTPTPATTVTGPPKAAPTIMAYMHVASDDGKFAIVEFVANDISAFATIMADKSITVFVKGTDSKASIEVALQKYKKNFSLDQFGVVLP